MLVNKIEVVLNAEVSKIEVVLYVEKLLVENLKVVAMRVSPAKVKGLSCSCNLWRRAPNQVPSLQRQVENTTNVAIGDPSQGTEMKGIMPTAKSAKQRSEKRPIGHFVLRRLDQHRAVGHFVLRRLDQHSEADNNNKR